LIETLARRNEGGAYHWLPEASPFFAYS